MKRPEGKLYYSISEISEMFAVSKSLLRFWENEFDILRPAKSASGERRFTRQNIEQIRLIYHLVKERGFTLDGAKKEIAANKERLEVKIKAIETLEKLKGFLLEMKDQLK